jgi:hypothetical protein
MHVFGARESSATAAAMRDYLKRCLGNEFSTAAAEEEEEHLEEGISSLGKRASGLRAWTCLGSRNLEINSNFTLDIIHSHSSVTIDLII